MSDAITDMLENERDRMWRNERREKITTVVNIRDHPDWKAEGGVYIGRGFRGQRGSTFANPFRIGKDGDRGVVLERYRTWMARRLVSHTGVAEELEALRGKMLVCWCAPEEGFKGRLMCHGQIIVEYLEGRSGQL